MDLTFGVAAAERNHGRYPFRTARHCIARGPHLKSMALLGITGFVLLAYQTARRESAKYPRGVQTVPAYIEEDDDDEIIIVSDKGVP